VNVVMNLWVPENAGNFLISLGPVSFSERILLHIVLIHLKPCIPLRETEQNIFLITHLLRTHSFNVLEVICV